MIEYTNTVNHALALFVAFPLMLGAIILWSLVWKGFALWRAGRDNQPIWFIALLLINTAGILEIIYLLFFSKKREGSSL